jgi:6-phosphogluconolactonase
MAKPAATFVHLYPDPSSLCRSAAEEVAAIALSAVDRKGKYAVALAGGSTPKKLYRTLASDYGKRLPWSRIHFFWGDERFVPGTDPLSNYKMAKEELLDRIRIPRSNIHSIATDFSDPESAALAYERDLRRHFGSSMPSFDLVILGMGSDGHIASLFPGAPALQETKRWVSAVRARATPPIRISLTLPVINAAKRIMVLVAGEKKKAAVERLLNNSHSGGSRLPAALLSPADELHWLLDRKAAPEDLFGN